MKYQVVIPKKAQKDLAKIDGRYKSRITAVLVALADNPFIGKKLEGEYKSERSCEVWPYRIIYRVNKESVVLIVRIGHRQNVYK